MPQSPVPGRHGPPVRQILAEPFQPRLDMGEMEEVAQCNRAQEIPQPLLVRQREAGFELVAGARRLEAARFLGLDSVPFRVLQVSDGEAPAITLAENLARSRLTPWEEARGLEEIGTLSRP